MPMLTQEQELTRRLARCVRLYGSDDPSVKMLRDALQRLKEGVRDAHTTYISGFRGTEKTKPKG